MENVKLRLMGIHDRLKDHVRLITSLTEDIPARMQTIKAEHEDLLSKAASGAARLAPGALPSDYTLAKAETTIRSMGVVGFEMLIETAKVHELSVTSRRLCMDSLDHQTAQLIWDINKEIEAWTLKSLDCAQIVKGNNSYLESLNKPTHVGYLLALKWIDKHGAWAMSNYLTNWVLDAFTPIHADMLSNSQNGLATIKEYSKVLADVIGAENTSG